MMKCKFCFIIKGILFLFLNQCSPTDRLPPFIKDGVLDLSNWDLDSEGPVPLVGEWEFFFGVLLEPESLQNNTILLKKTLILAPANWNNFGYDVNNVATYRVLIRPLEYPKLYAIKLPHFASAYKLYINGKFVSENGVVNQKKEIYKPQHLPTVKYVFVDKPEMEILIQVANFSDNISGIVEKIYIGTENFIIKKYAFSIGTEIFYFGIILIMGIYHLFLFFFRRTELAPLFFGLFSLIMALRIAITGEKFFLQIFPDFPWEVHIKAEYLSVFLGLPFFALFLFYTFQQRENYPKTRIIEQLFSQNFIPFSSK
ncbi:MAG: 7TM-DISM domain-containing protein [Leptospiraceae bacterium]|nr:7TM-DISM domain-containing protein [Leptospiraceae bacterium]